MNESEVDKGFEWRLEEEEGWPEARPGPAAKRAARHVSKWWLALGLVLLCLVGVVGLLAQRQWQRRLAVVAQSATADLLVVHGLAQQAAARRDSELIATLLHEPNSRWGSVQIDLIRAELYLDRPGLGFWFDPAAPATREEDVPEVRLSPDLERAEVVMLLPYLVQTGDEETATIRLQQTYFFERSRADGRWLLAPPPEADFWQSWITERQEHFSLIFPGRDEAVGRRLAVDLNRLLDRLCRETAVTCPTQPALFQVRLDREPESLMLLAENYRRESLTGIGRQLNLRLPAPSLVGIPIDEAGYEALYRGYAGWIAAVLVRNADRQAATLPEVTSLLAALDLRPPPAPGFHPLVGQRPPPVPFPEQELQLLCNWFDGASIWRYRPLDETWWPEWTPANDRGLRFMRDEAAMEALPGGQGVLLYGRQAVDGIPRWRAYLWRDGQAQLLLDEAEPHFPVTSPWIWTPAPVAVDERFVLFLPPDPAGQYLPYGPVRAVELGQCSASGCQVWEFDGFPSWSPDGRLVTVNSAAGSWAELHLVRYESSGRRASLPLGAGFSAFWWDNERLGFIRPLFTSGQSVPESTELVVGRLTSPTSNAWQEEVWLAAAELRAALPAGYAAVEHGLFISGAAKYPGRPGWLLIRADMVRNDGAYHASFLYAFQPATGDIRYLMPAVSISPVRIDVSPNGRYLAGADSGSIWIYAFDEETRHMLYRYGATDLSWSGDEQWLALAEEGQIRLVAIERDYQRIVPHDYRACSTLAWVDTTDLPEEEND
jgi:hypothetical protein